MPEALNEIRDKAAELANSLAEDGPLAAHDKAIALVDAIDDAIAAERISAPEAAAAEQADATASASAEQPPATAPKPGTNELGAQGDVEGAEYAGHVPPEQHE
ncbi:MAG TPA: hypothetical protein VJ818_08605 [Actinomycetota bacterium]|nr:hypothetical protein [Actinomycetota bacterium]